eukprot:scaffold5369_cov214-Alexandrium_tamarense.AAC.3
MQSDALRGQRLPIVMKKAEVCCVVVVGEGFWTWQLSSAKDIQPAPRFDFKKYVKNVGDGYSMRPFDILQRQIQVKSSGVGDSSTAHTNQTRTFAAAFFTFTCPKESRLDCIGIVIRGRGNNPSNQVVLLMHQFG